MNWGLVGKLVKKRAFSYHDNYIENSELLLNDEFVFQHAYSMEPSPEKYQLLSWYVSPNEDPEWLFVLKRQEYLQDLLYTYLVSKDIKYLNKTKEYIFSWIQNNYDDEKVRYVSWRTIDTGIRLLNWSMVFNLLKTKEMLTNVESERLNNIVNQQAQYLKNNYIDKYDLSNWGVLITTGILTFDAVNPKCIDKKLVDWASDRFAVEMKIQVDDEGMHWEQSPLYFVEVFRSALCVYAASKEENSKKLNDLKSTLVKMLKAFGFQMMPDDKLLQQGDTDAVNVRDLYNSAENILLGKEVNNNLDFLTSMLYYASNTETIRMDIEEKFDAFISGNFFAKNKNNYIHVFNGNLGSGHGHAANGHVDLMINKNKILIDPGRYTYVNSKLRRKLKAAESHNVVMIDGQFPTIPKDSWKYSRVLLPVGNEVKHTLDVDAYKMVILDSDNEQYQVRYVVWMNHKNMAVVIDVVSASGRHEAQSNWIFDKEIKVDVNNEEKNIILRGQDESYKLWTSTNSKISVVNQDFSARYNECDIVQKLRISDSFENYYVNFVVIGEADDVTQLTARQAGTNEDVSSEKCYGFRIQNKTEKIDFVLQHVNTFVGNKLYYVDDKPVYGELNIISKNGTHRIF